MPSRSTTGISSRPDQKKRWKARSAGEKPIEMPCLAATKPAAQPKRRAGAAQHADQDAGGVPPQVERLSSTAMLRRLPGRVT